MLKKLINTDEKRKIFKNFSYLFILQGLTYIFPMILLPYLLPVLGAEKYGVIAWVQSVIVYFAVFVDFGFNLSATKRISQAKNQEERSKIFWATTSAKILFVIISFLCLILLIQTIPIFSKNATLFFIWFLTVVATIITPYWLFMGIEQMKWIAIISIIGKIITFPLFFILVKDASDYIVALWLQTVTIIVAGIGCVFIIYFNHFIQWSQIKIKDIVFEIKESKHLFFSQATITLYTAGFIVVLGFLATEEQVGVYAATDKIFKALGTAVYLPLSQVLYPRISMIAKNNLVIAISKISKISWLIIILMGGLSIMLFCGSNLIANYVGKNYSNISLFIKIIAILPIPWALAGIFGQIGLLACGGREEKKNYSKIYIISSILALPVVFILTFYFNNLGTLVAMIFAELMVFFMAFRYWKIFLKKVRI